MDVFDLVDDSFYATMHAQMASDPSLQGWHVLADVQVSMQTVARQRLTYISFQAVVATD